MAETKNNLPDSLAKPDFNEQWKPAQDFIVQENKLTHDKNGNSSHYKQGRIDVMVMLERVYGTEAAMLFCEMNAFKYRLRLGHKNQDASDLIKIKWYEKAALFFSNRLAVEKGGLEQIDIKDLQSIITYDNLKKYIFDF